MLLAVLGAFQIAAAQPGPVYNGRAGQITAHAPRIDTTVTIDGRLDEPVWTRAATLTGFSEYSPADQRPSPDSTEVLVWYSRTAMYFGIRAYEPHGPVRATLADRDNISSDDNVEIHLDTYDERNRALVFIVNPLGIQADGIRNETGGFIPGSNVGPGQTDLSADFLWDSKGHVTPWGYEVEIRIPFSSLRYPSTSVQDWGIQILRNVQHNGYKETWTQARSGAASFINQEGLLQNLHDMHHGQVVGLNPELTNTVTGVPCCDASLTSWKYTSRPQLGGNVRWAIGSNFVLNGTVKPDFSQVEADATQIAADARFALFYREKRPFFVEGSDRFNVPNTLVYTRTIVQPSAAAKLTGTLGRTDIAFLSALDASSTTSNGKHPLVDILRLNRGFAGQSVAGFLYSDRVGGGRSNRVVDADVHYVFGGLYYAQFQAAMSSTNQNGVSATAPMWEAVLDRTGRAFGFHYNVFGVGSHFAADNGFVPRTGVVEPSVSNRLSLYGAPGAWLEKFNVFLQTSGVWRYNDFFARKSLLEDHASGNTNFTLRGGWSVGVTPTISTYAFDPAAYSNDFISNAPPVPFVPSPRITTFVTSFKIATPLFAGYDASAGINTGNDVDFLETSRVRRLDYNASVNLRPTQQLRVNATYVSSAFTRRSDGARSASTRIPRVKIEYQVTRSVFVRLVTQYTATTRSSLLDPRTGQSIFISDDTTYTPSVANVSNGLRTDWLFSYRPSPGTVFFAGYGNSMTEPDPLAFRGLRRTADGFFVKVSYLLQSLGAS
ncbi:MAG: carbohydrate binding family 9 domain-containing protein [Gemmatimonadota bacterium]|nr:carbohydrate binding family 9 domain-containing protein [Gemmatimonadota bacterium]